ncbi:site-2 protease family protein [Nocardiopsis kunsanensis]|uniref:site-2 protease family protein n=1 Tax=Nocardiopsis kunsanensis TaxID=141693 RepID=UPI00034B90D2|nr:site-2 protease family protein [Nocardiopsis kunsanensis]
MPTPDKPDSPEDLWERMPDDAANVPDLAGEGSAGEEAEGTVSAGSGAGATSERGADEGTGATEAAEGSAPAKGRAGETWTDFLPSPVLLFLLGSAGFAGWLSWTAVEMDWASDDTDVTPLIPPLLVLLGWLVSTAVHEFAHALAAYLAGDRSLRGSGYLRLNPFAYRETFTGTVLPVLYLGVGSFGMNGPAGYVDWDRIPTRGRRAAVALAGPAASLLLAAAFGGAVSIMVPPGNDTTNWALAALAFLCMANLTSALVNLLPVPGLDMFEALAPDRPWVRKARVNQLFFSVGVFAVLALPGINTWLQETVFALFGLIMPNPTFPGTAFLGQLLWQFWAS